MKKYLIVGIVALTMAFVAVSADAAIVRNLTVGSQGADVAELQAFLISRGHNIPAISSGVAAPGYFGSQTKAAVMAYQAANGIPNTGFFGPLTRASVNTALGSGGTTGGNVACPAGYVCTPVATTPVCPVGFVCTPVNGGTATPGNNGLSGVFGTVADVNLLSQYSNEDVGEGEGEVRVLGFEVEATNDGDILLRSLRISFDPSGNDGSTRLNRYIDSVTIWQGDEEIGRADVDEFTEGNNDVSLYMMIRLLLSIFFSDDDLDR